ncbi:tetraacyldisaccharide 4'-kinase [Pontiella agarivorans]|uniref:Tetraacyldisaccharide 4'-kinase n=1 Tax=Pontiella agarivorans TaxID=3038953 RepID=A0ABU5MTC1_9BACT|nr:tetraacyldisaccharide 4'-kinase [Pontiella agarivorans]MDZ8117469.1 tetraacyldisaccharide 4'-kinase [Pontiella agarivorans]
MAHKRKSEQLETYLLSVIDGSAEGKWPSVLRVIMAIFSWLFTLIVQTRIQLYKHRIIRGNTLGCQVISVGNLTVGGTGKTPVVEVFARNLQQQGRKVAILSRGYKSKEASFKDKMIQRITTGRIETPPRVVSDGKRLLLDSWTAGDEPYMLATNLPEVAVVVDKDRVKAGKYAIRELGCDTLILDDGFQYLKVGHRLDIALVDSTNPFGYGHLLPRGLLREPMRNIKRAGFIFITKCKEDGAPELKEQLRRLNPVAEISECRHAAKYLKDVFGDTTYPLEKLKGLKVAAVSAIAVPESFESALEAFGAEIVYVRRFADHHRFSQQEIINTINWSAKRGAQAILTTEKDAVRFPFVERRDIPIHYMRVEIEMLSGEEEFMDWIMRICFKTPRDD